MGSEMCIRDRLLAGRNCAIRVDACRWADPVAPNAPLFCSETAQPARKCQGLHGQAFFEGCRGSSRRGLNVLTGHRFCNLRGTHVKVTVLSLPRTTLANGVSCGKPTESRLRGCRMSSELLPVGQTSDAAIPAGHCQLLQKCRPG